MKRLACLLSIVVAACATPPASEPVKPTARPAPLEFPEPTKVVRIAHVAPMTRALTHVGRDNAWGARLAIDEANEVRLRLDGEIVRFVLIEEDDQAEPRTAAQVAQKMVNSSVAGVVGHLNSGTSIPASAVYHQAGIPMLTPSASNPRLTEQGFDNVFRLISRDDAQGGAIAAYLVRYQVQGPVAVLNDGTAYGELVARSLERELFRARVPMVPGLKVDARTLPAVVAELRNRQPPAVFYGGMDAGAAPLLRRAREQGVRSTFYFSDGACIDETAKLAGAAAEGFVCVQSGIPPQAAPRRFLNAYERRYGQPPVLYAPFTYDAVNVLVTAMTRAGSADPRRYLPELRRTNQVGMTGPIEFDERGDRRHAAQTIFMMVGGRLRPVAIVSGGTVTPYETYVERNASR
jgi:branched-chain amino acid transport system substrate-binding protein